MLLGEQGQGLDRLPPAQVETLYLRSREGEKEGGREGGRKGGKEGGREGRRGREEVSQFPTGSGLYGYLQQSKLY